MKEFLALKGNLSVMASIVAALASIISITFFLFEAAPSLLELSSVFVSLTGVVVGFAFSLFSARYFARAKGPSLFVSYHHGDIDTAKKIAHELKDISDNVWFDETEIRLGENIKTRIQDGLESSDIVLLILPSHETHGDWTQHEITTARKLGKPILPIKIGASTIPYALRDIAYLDMSEIGLKNGIEKLRRSLLADTKN